MTRVLTFIPNNMALLLALFHQKAVKCHVKMWIALYSVCSKELINVPWYTNKYMGTQGLDEFQQVYKNESFCRMKRVKFK